MWQSERGIILSSVRHNDKTCVVRIFTESRGTVPFIFFLSKTGKNASRNTVLQPLTQVEFQTQYVPSATLQHMREVKNAVPYGSIPFSPMKSSIALYLSEMLSGALSGEQSNPGLFRYMSESFQWFDSATDGTYSNFHLLFTLGIAQYIGICPNFFDWTEGAVLDLREGCFVNAIPPYPEYVSEELSAKMADLAGHGYDNMDETPLTGQERVRLLEIMGTYFKMHVPSFPNLKSLEVLQAVFG